MALFGGKAKNQAQEEFVWNKLTNGEVIKILTAWLQISDDDEDSWAIMQTGYYDDRKRTVVVSGDSVYIFRCSVSKLYEASSALKSAKFASATAFSVRATIRADEKRAKFRDAFDDVLDSDGIIFNCTDYGFKPLSAYEDQENDISVPRERVLKVWAVVVKALMEKLYNDFEFGSVDSDSELFGTTVYTFGYTVPSYGWKSWF